MFNNAYDHHTRPQDKAHLAQAPHIDFAQRAWEISQLLSLYIQRKPKHVLEIGTWQGGTLYGWLKYATPGATILTVDDNPALDEWQAWQVDGVEHVHLVGNSQMQSTIAKVYDWMPEVDFLFIDADHTYGGVLQDFNNYGPLVKSGGVIALHDIIKPAPERNQPHIEVHRLWQEIQRAGYATQEFVCSPNQDWGGIGVVYP